MPSPVNNSATRHDDVGFHAWNPGITSPLPGNLISQQTIFLPENIQNTFSEIQELADFSGIPITRLAEFRLERLLVHEVLIWVTANLSVPDGPRYEDFGVNIRSMVDQLLQTAIWPRLDELSAHWHRHLTQVAECFAQIIDQEQPDSEAPDPQNGLPWIAKLKSLMFRSPAAPSVDHAGQQTPDLPFESQFAPELIKHCEKLIHEIRDQIRVKRGPIKIDQDLLTKLALIEYKNTAGPAVLRDQINDYLLEASNEHHFRLLPSQKQPVVLNVKGASASGKSSLRPLHNNLVDRLGLYWAEFSVVSPDYWRKYLLDYDSLGSQYKYAGLLTAEELAIVDLKLDAFMAQKAKRQEMPHLLIDRFRFDSFSSVEERESTGKLLTRFGQKIYLFFLVTPPHQTIERAWIRGLETGRYKPVDDLLAHNVEAYNGFPGLFFSWISSKDKIVHFEFLDNSVPKGEQPRTIASGWNEKMEVFDLQGLLDIHRFRYINLDAKDDTGVYQRESMLSTEDALFMQHCMKEIATINFINVGSGAIYASIKNHALYIYSEQEAPTPDHLELLKKLTGTLTPDAIADAFSSEYPERLNTMHDVGSKRLPYITINNVECDQAAT